MGFFKRSMQVLTVVGKSMREKIGDGGNTCLSSRQTHDPARTLCQRLHRQGSDFERNAHENTPGADVLICSISRSNYDRQTP